MIVLFAVQTTNSATNSFPSIDFYQSANTVTVVIYTKQVPLSHENVIVDIRQSELLIEVTLSLHSFFVHVSKYTVCGGAKCTEI